MDNDINENHEEDGKDERKIKGGGRNTTVVFFVLTAVFAAIALILIPSTASAFAFIAAAICLFVALWLLFVKLYEKKRSKRFDLTMPVAALALDLATALFVWLGTLDHIGVFNAVFLLATVLSPIAGMIVGVLSLGKYQKIGKAGLIISIIAILLPVLCVVVIIALFSSGVAVIRFM